MMEKSINILVNDLKQIFGKRLISIIQYGNIVPKSNKTKFVCSILPNRNKIPVEMVVILDKLESSDLKCANKPILKWKKTAQPLPIFMDKDEWFNSTDIYPMEYSDIKSRHKILYGEDLTESIKINKSYLRLQCEYELKNVLIRLRETYLGNANNKKYINFIILDNLNKIINIFRSVLELLEMSAPEDAELMINQLTEKTEIDLNLFIDLNKENNVSNTEETIKEIIDSLTILLKYVDSFEV